MIIRIILNLILVKCGELCYSICVHMCVCICIHTHICIYMYHFKRKSRFFLTKYLKFFIVHAITSFSVANYKRNGALLGSEDQLEFL